MEGFMGNKLAKGEEYHHVYYNCYLSIYFLKK